MVSLWIFLVNDLTITNSLFFPFSAAVSMLCRRSDQDHLAWRAHARTNSRRSDSWSKRTDDENPWQDGLIGLSGLFNLHSSVYSHPRSHSTRSAWDCCLQRHAGSLEMTFRDHLPAVMKWRALSALSLVENNRWASDCYQPIRKRLLMAYVILASNRSCKMRNDRIPNHIMCFVVESLGGHVTFAGTSVMWLPM